METTSVNILNGDVKFQYEDGESRTLTASESKQFINLYEGLKDKFPSPEAAKLYVASRYFD